MSTNTEVERARRQARAIAKDFSERMEEKYVAGQVEHGGNLDSVTNQHLIRGVREELLDAYAYLQHLAVRFGADATMAVDPIWLSNWHGGSGEDEKATPLDSHPEQEAHQETPPLRAHDVGVPAKSQAEEISELKARVAELEKVVSHVDRRSTDLGEQVDAEVKAWHQRMRARHLYRRLDPNAD